MNYGQVGSPIANSIYVRDYCYECKEPIRVAKSRVGKLNACDSCRKPMRRNRAISEANRKFLLLDNLDLLELSGLRTQR